MPQTAPLYRAYRPYSRPYSGTGQSLTRPTLADLYRQGGRGRDEGGGFVDRLFNFASSTVGNIMSKVPEEIGSYFGKKVYRPFEVVGPKGTKYKPSTNLPSRPKFVQVPLRRSPLRLPRGGPLSPPLSGDSDGPRNIGPPISGGGASGGARTSGGRKIRSTIYYELNR